VLYNDLPDRLFNAPGNWNFKLCSDPSCELLWLDPVPAEEEVAKAYARYYTHVESTKRNRDVGSFVRQRLSDALIAVDPLRRERDHLLMMYLDKSLPGKLLDVGCGNGARLARLRALGWEVCGQDLDPQAVSFAVKTFGLQAYQGRLEDIRFPEASFDYITLNHVVEHSHDPVRLLKECRRLLKKGGLLVIVTPNGRSFAHKYFGPFWRGLEPPRHIHIFSPKTLSILAAKAGLSVFRSWTTVANAVTFGRGSLMVKRCGCHASSLGSRIFRAGYLIWYLYRSMMAHKKDFDSGEECVLQATN
jgi:2-polyprenyl-3-methyl-5-hydroxy-6-metoxy-1,4-benzoquinol methylase